MSSAPQAPAPSVETVVRSLHDAWKAVAERSASAPHLYAVVDCARDPMIIPPMIEAMAKTSECLFRGKARENLGDQAPWAVAVDPNEDFLDWLVEDGFGRRWASFAVSPLGIRDFASHLRRFTMVEDEAGTLHYFRFYDPQVLRQYLPAFDVDQTARFFRGVEAWIVENSLRPDELLEFTLVDGRTRRRALPIGTERSETGDVTAIENRASESRAIGDRPGSERSGEGRATAGRELARS